MTDPFPFHFHRSWFVRPSNDRVTAGVASGIAASIGVEVIFVRLAFVLLAAATGVGLVLYVAAYFFSVPEDAAHPVVRREVTQKHTLGFMCMVLGSLVVCGSWGLLAIPGVTIPVAVLIAASALVWLRSDDPVRSLFSGRHMKLRLVASGLIVAIGVGTFLSQNDALHSLRSTLLAIIATGIGLSLLFGPWLDNLYRDLSDERRQRIRSEERAEMGAHLHDSVLHTLALIQRADVPPDVSALARKQERDLRAWLLGQSGDETADIRSAFDRVVDHVESAYPIKVDVVIVGESDIDERVTALVQAAQEALVNAARHSGANTVSVYVEIEQSQITAYVRDDGNGFDSETVPADRRGIAESITGRMQRAGGSATIRSYLGEGTEVELQIQREHS